MFEQTLKMAGFAVNLVILAFFGILALVLTSYGLSFLAAAGGLPSASSVSWALTNPIGVINSIALGVTTGSIFSSAVHYGGAWVTIIVAMGAWWMTALGLRWLYFSISRAVSN